MRTLWTFSLVLTMLVAAGCKNDRKALNPGSYQIDVAVWAVVGQSESLGNPSNNGCRFTAAQITSLMDQLRRNASVFGVNTRFMWDGMINVVQNSRTNRIYTSSQFIQDIFLGTTVYAVEDAINIYFVGDINNAALGFTIQPDTYLDTGDIAGIKYIRVIDGGYSGSGSDLDLLSSHYTLEHEIGHYIGRFNRDVNMDGSLIIGRSFGAGSSARNYDQNEHLASSRFLMVEAGLGALNIPGTENPSVEELGEVSQRIRAGLWNEP